MKLKDMKNKICALLDISGDEETFVNYSAAVIDSAAKKVAVYTKSIKKSADIEFLPDNGKVSAVLPEDFAAFCYVRSGKIYYGREVFEIISEKIRSDIIGAGVFEIVYTAFPPEINSQTQEETEIFINDYICDAVCYGAAMELCSNFYPSDVQRYMRLATEYDERLANLLTSASDGARIANSFFAGARGAFV